MKESYYLSSIQSSHLPSKSLRAVGCCATTCEFLLSARVIVRSSLANSGLTLIRDTFFVVWEVAAAMTMRNTHKRTQKLAQKCCMICVGGTGCPLWELYGHVKMKRQMNRRGARGGAGATTPQGTAR